jgi:WD40 repeat protein
LVECQPPDDDTITDAAFSPDGGRIVTASPRKTPRLWDTRTGKQLAVLRGHDDLVGEVAFSPDGSLVVTASQDKTAQVWDVATAREVLTLRHDNPVLRAAFAADGRHVFTVAGDTARRWPLDPLAIAQQRKPRGLNKAEKERFGIAAAEVP